MPLNSPKTLPACVPLVPGVAQTNYQGYPSLQLSNAHGKVIVSLHGGQVLSWIPAGQREVFWLSKLAKPAPAAIRGGVPVCWPWFGKQAMPHDAMQHGPVRNVNWTLAACEATQNESLLLSLEPDRTTTAACAIDRYAKHLDVRLDIELGTVLRMGLRTLNRGTEPFALTQALHTY